MEQASVDETQPVSRVEEERVEETQPVLKVENGIAKRIPPSILRKTAVS